MDVYLYTRVYVCKLSYIFVVTYTHIYIYIYLSYIPICYWLPVSLGAISTIILQPAGALRTARTETPRTSRQDGTEWFKEGPLIGTSICREAPNSCTENDKHSSPGE